MRYSNDFILEKLKSYFNQHKHIISRNKMKDCDHFPFSSSTIENRFGSYNQAWIEAVGKCNPRSIKLPRKDVKCGFCNKSFKKRMKDIQKTNGNFCSKTCAAKYNNRIYPKRAKEGECSKCKSVISSSRHYCAKCWKLKTKDNFTNSADITKRIFLGCANKTLSEVMNKGSSRYRRVREHANKVCQPLDRSCQICGYTQYVELAHIKAISTFDKDTLVKDVNSLKNLIFLCPNHHKEQEYGDIDVTGINVSLLV